MNSWVIAAAILIGAAVISGAMLLRPSPFRECVTIISADTFRQDPTVTLDPRDVEAEAARICSGVAV